MPRTVFRKSFRSMRLAMLTATVISVGLAIGAFLLIQLGATSYIKNNYISEENKLKREMEYARELQEYVIENDLSSGDVEMLAKWAQGNRYLYVMIHKDDKLLFETGKFDDEFKKPTDTPDEGNTEQPPEPPVGDENTEGGTENGDSTESDAETGEEDGRGSIGSGITVDMPTREELVKYAIENGAHLITMSDASVLVSMADFSEYLYYDITNITAILAAVIVLASSVLLYSHGVTRRITKIAGDVAIVVDGNMYHSIRTDGKDELGRLSHDVESMRSTMLENLKKEREAMDANAELVTSMSHDIRTPLTVLLGYLNVMKLHSTDEEMLSYIRASEKTALRLKKLSDDMFNYFLLFGGGASEVDLQDYDAYTLLDQMLSEHVLLLREQGYNVESDVAEIRGGKPTVRTDANYLKRIVENVISNVFKYADIEKPVLFSGRVEGESVYVSVTNGVRTDSADAESNGIGIKTCRKLAGEMGARLETEEADGKYTVTLTLPLTATEEKR
ncbi:MAG: hypothetical protein IJF05_05940 [Clostridia bacterium]|nr:hypothetical protein [Clostridia bacterium]